MRRQASFSSFAAVLIVAIAPLWAASAWTPSCDETRDGQYQFTNLGGNTAQPVRVSLCSDARCGSPRAFKAVTEDSLRVPTPRDVARPFFLLERSGVRRIIAARRLVLEGAYNFRDLGGLTTQDGKAIRWGQIFRSDALANLTAADYVRLNQIGISLVCDLRTREERRTSPTEWKDGSPMFVLAPISEDEKGNVRTTDMLSRIQSGKVSVEEGRIIFEQFYTATALDSAPKFGAVLRSIANAQRPSMFHCQGGRDRTGMTAAMLLQILGVPRDKILADYVLSTKYLSERPASAAAATTPEQQEIAQRYAEVIELQPRYIEAVFRAIDKKYGSFDHYRRNGLGLTDEEVRKLKSRLLE
jgi:protein-tyrosine phosphatase